MHFSHSEHSSNCWLMSALFCFTSSLNNGCIHNSHICWVSISLTTIYTHHNHIFWDSQYLQTSQSHLLRLNIFNCCLHTSQSHLLRLDVFVYTHHNHICWDSISLTSICAHQYVTFFCSFLLQWQCTILHMVTCHLSCKWLFCIRRATSNIKELTSKHHSS